MAKFLLNIIVLVLTLSPPCVFNLTGQINPASLSGLKLWLSSDSVIKNSLNQVSQWTDLSGNTNHAIQSDTTQQPIYINNILSLNNKPVLRFDSLNDFLEIADTPSVDFTNKMSIFIVNTQKIIAADKAILVKWDYATQGSWSLETGNELRVRIANALSDNGANLVSTANAMFTGNNYSLLSVVYDGTQAATSRVKCYKNTSILSTSTSGTIATTMQNSTATLKIGMFGGGLSRYYNGDIAEIIIYNQALADSSRTQVEQYLRNKYAPPVALGLDFMMPSICDTTLDAGVRFTKFQWNGDSAITNQIFTVSKPGKYWVDVTDIFGFISTDTINVTYPYYQPALFDTICLGDTLIWNTQLIKNNKDFLWSTGSSDSLLNITSAGTYKVIVTDSSNGCTWNSDSVTVTVDTFRLAVSLGQDDSLCAGNSISLIQGQSEATSYIWSDSSVNNSLVINTSGTYSVKVTNVRNCIAFDTIIVSIKGTAPTVYFSNPVTCNGDSVQFTDSSYTTDSSIIISRYWDFGDTTFSSLKNPSHKYSASGNYSVKLTDTTNAGCSGTLIKNIIIHPLPVAAFNSTVALCVGNNINFTDNSTITTDFISGWSWDFGDTFTSAIQNPSHNYSNAGNYTIKFVVTTSVGCKDSVLKEIALFPCNFPNNISGIQLWLSGESATKNSLNQVSQWTDLSGNTNHAIQNDTAQQPIYINNILSLNNKPVLRFDSLNDFLEIADNSSVDFTNKMSIFIVTTQKVIAADKAILAKWDYSTQGSWALQTENDLKLYIANTLSDNGSNFVLTTNALLTGNNYSLLSVVYDGTLAATSRVKYYKNTSILSTTTSGTIATTLQNSTATLKIGMFGGGLSRHYNGDIAEIIIYNQALADSERTKIEQYLRYKYAPPVNLGADITKTNFCPVTINAKKDWFTSYKWSASSIDTLDNLTVNKSGTYSVTVTDIFGFTSTDTIKATFPGNLSPFVDSTICLGNSLLWNTGLPAAAYTFLWSNNETTPAISISTAETYKVTVTDNIGCSIVSGVANVKVDTFSLFASVGPADTFFCAGNSLALITGAQQAVSYLWSTTANTPSIVVTNPGPYSVIVTDTLGCQAFDTITVSIKGIAPTVGFIAVNACLEDSVTFTDTSTVQPGVIKIWQWQFGDSTFSNETNPTHLYLKPGVFNVTLTATTDSGCTSNLTKTVKVFDLPQPNFLVSPPILCSGKPIGFSDSSSPSEALLNKWLWSFGDSTSDSVASPSHIFVSSGTYNVSFVVWDTLGCRDTMQKTLNINPSPVAGFVFNSGCEDLPTQFNDNSVGFNINWNWNFGDNLTGTGDSPSHIYDTAGTYSVSLVVNNIFGCSDTVLKNVSVNYSPVAAFYKTDFCNGIPTQVSDSSTVPGSYIKSWKWKVQNSSIESSDKNPYLNFPSTGDYLLQLTVTTGQGCKDDTTLLVKSHAPPFSDFTFTPQTGSPPLPVTLSNISTGSVLYHWNFGNGDTSISFNPSYTYKDSGIFYITLISYNVYGCYDSSSSKKIKVVTPLLDLAVTACNITYSPDGKFLGVTAQVFNKGTSDVSFFDILTDFNSSSSVRELCTKPLESKQTLNYTFNASFEIIGGTLPAAICVRTENPNGKKDDNPTNDELCITFSDFKVLNLYPNPANDEITMEYIIPGSEKVEMSISDVLGRWVKHISPPVGEKGLYRMTINTDDLSAGVYAIFVRYGENTSVVPFVKMEK